MSLQIESNAMREGQAATPSVTQRVRRAARDASRLFSRFASEEHAQDLVEYAFLAAFIGVTSFLVLNGIRDAIGTVYASWLDPTVGVPSAWNPPEPPAPPAGAGS